MSKTVALKSREVKEMEPFWNLTTALLGGTAAMREANTEYLPKWPKEDDKVYACRLAVATLYPAYEHSITTLASKPFSKAVTKSDDMPKEIKEWCEDIDRQGRNLDTFGADVFNNGLGMGLAGILVEYPDPKKEEEGKPAVPSNQAGVRTRADEEKAGLRPYWVHILAKQLLGWVAAFNEGRWRFLQLRFMESVKEKNPADEFEELTISQIRVLEPRRWRTFRLLPGSTDEWVQHKEGVNTLGDVPFVPVYGGKRVGFMMAHPALRELAYLNVKHWQSQSDQDTILHVARVPVIFMKGFPKGTELVVGANATVCATDDKPNADIKYVEHTGAAIEAGQKSLQDLEEQMRQAGAEVLVLRPIPTATQVGSEETIGMCLLQRIALDFQDALNLALDYTAKWARLPKGGTVALFDDYGIASLAEATATLLHQRNVAGKLSDETTFQELQRRGILSGGLKYVEEKERIESEGPPPGMLGIDGLPAPGPAPAPGPRSPAPPASRQPGNGGAGPARM